MKYVTTIGSNEYQVEITSEGQVSVDGVEYQVDFRKVGDQPVYSLLIDGLSYEAYVHPAENAWQVLLRGNFYNSQVEDERERRLRLAFGSVVSERQEFYLKSPMPGLIIDIPVEEGQQVEKGDVLVILESMKMQNELGTPRAGKVTRMNIKSGDRVDQNQVLMSVE